MNLAVDEFTRLIQACLDRGIRFDVIGVWAANYHALRGSMIFATHERDLFLPLDPDNELEALDSLK